MPLHLARRLTGHARSPSADRHLGCFLAATAGAVNAIGFAVLGQYTSHMTGMAAAFAEHLVAGAPWIALAAATAVATFACGAATCAVMVRQARRNGLRALFALPLLLEAGVLLAVGLAGLHDATFAASHGWTALCAMTFAMGLQNALITKISRGEIRTTHVTGIVTDLGIEWGRALARETPGAGEAAPRARALTLALLLAAFVAGCVAGAYAAPRHGIGTLLPLAAALGLAAVVPALDDVAALASGRRGGPGAARDD